MRFTKETILSLDDDQFSPMEKRLLVEKFFPKAPRASWHDKIAEIQRWRHYLNSGLTTADAKPYRFSHEWLIREAKHRPPPVPRNAVSDFSGWVFSLYRPRPTPESLEDGQRVERAVARLVLPPSNKQWELIFEDPLIENKPIKSISSLTVHGKPLHAVPDVVFREKATGRILIVERKASNKEIPSDGWPNLRAQLWAYAKIDEWIDAPDILLVGEIWGFQADKVFPRAVIRWSRNDPDFDRTNSELFQLYGGCHA